MYSLCDFCKKYLDCEFINLNKLTFFNDELISQGDFELIIPDYIKQIGNYHFNGGFSYIVLDCEQFEEEV